jgi:hypothetical protein
MVWLDDDAPEEAVQCEHVVTGGDWVIKYSDDSIAFSIAIRMSVGSDREKNILEGGHLSPLPMELQ